MSQKATSRKVYLVFACEYDWEDYYPHSVHLTESSAEKMVAFLQTPEPDLKETEQGYGPYAYASSRGIELYE